MGPVPPPPEAPSFEYAVVESCPVEAEAKPLFAAGPRRTRVVVWFDGRNYGGTVSFVGPDDADAERTLNGPTCKVVLEALALSMAVALDAPKAPTGPSYVVEEQPPPVEPPPPRPRSRSFVRGVDLGVGAWVGSQPSPALAASLAVVVGSTHEESSVWAPRLRLGYAASFPSSASAQGSDRTSAFYSFVVRIEGCPVEVGKSRWLFSPCLRQELGVLVGTAPQDGRRVNDFVGATGVSALTQWWLEDEGRWFLQAELAGLVPWRRLRYTSEEGGEYFQIAPVVGQIGLSVGVSTK